MPGLQAVSGRRGAHSLVGLLAGAVLGVVELVFLYMAGPVRLIRGVVKSRAIGYTRSC
jgi:hypothetical protein